MKCLVFALLFAAEIASAKTTVVKGKIFPHDTLRSKPTYLYKRTTEEEGEMKTVRAEFLGLNGELLVEEIYRYEKDRLKSYIYNQKQMREGGEITLKDDRIFYSFTKEGKTYKDDEEMPENFIVPDLVNALLEKHGADLIEKNETVRTRYLVLERQDSYGFKFFADGEQMCGTTTCARIIMKPSGFLIAAFVDPIKILIEQKPPYKIHEINGRLPIRVPEVPDPKVRKDYVAIDAVLAFE